MLTVWGQSRDIRADVDVVGGVDRHYVFPTLIWNMSLSLLLEDRRSNDA